MLAGDLHLTEQLSLLLSEVSGEFDLISDDEVAEGAVTSVITLTTQTHFRAWLRLGFYLHLDFLTIGEREDDLTTQ